MPNTRVILHGNPSWNATFFGTRGHRTTIGRYLAACHLKGGPRGSGANLKSWPCGANGQQRQTNQISLTALRSLGKIILDDEISDDELRARLFAVVSREELVACVDNIGEWVTGKRSDLFQGIVRRHRMLRKFSPALLDAFLGRPIDEYPGNARLIQTIKGIFLAGKWWLVFDILETALDMQDVMVFAEEFAIESINKALAESAYMLVYDEITERFPVEQSVSIETALTSPFSSARTHFEKAFRALNRRPECEPGEVIRESIHAVEATCRELCGDQNNGSRESAVASR